MPYLIADMLSFLDPILPEGEFLGNPARRWAAALIVFVVGVVVLRIAKSVLRARAATLARRRVIGNWMEGVVQIVDATRLWFLVAAAAFLASLALTLDGRALAFSHAAAALILILQAALWANALIAFAVTHYTRERLDIDAASVTTARALAVVGKIAVWSLALLLMLDNFGIDVTALVAGLGIGGIAVALAAQNILGDLFASLSIVLDKPFVLGDFIIVGDLMGTVEHIGLKTTRLRSLSGEQLIFSNNDLLQSRIRNYKRMEQRRIVFSLGVTYDTPADKIKAIPAILRAAVEKQQQVRFDRAHFKEYGDSSLLYEVVYIVQSADFNLYMDIQQQINFDILDRFQAEKIEFAFPTRTVYAQVTNLGELARRASE